MRDGARRRLLSGLHLSLFLMLARTWSAAVRTIARGCTAWWTSRVSRTSRMAASVRAVAALGDGGLRAAAQTRRARELEGARGCHADAGDPIRKLRIDDPSTRGAALLHRLLHLNVASDGAVGRRHPLHRGPVARNPEEPRVEIVRHDRHAHARRRRI